MTISRTSLSRGSLHLELLSWMDKWKGFSEFFALLFCSLLRYMSSLISADIQEHISDEEARTKEIFKRMIISLYIQDSIY